MAFLTILVLFLFKEVLCEPCICENPTCLGITIPQAGFVRSAPGGVLLTETITERPQLTEWTTSRPKLEETLWLDGETKNGKVSQTLFEAIQGTQMENCAVKAVLDTTFVNLTKQDIVLGKIKVSEFGGDSDISKCGRKGLKVFICGGTVGYVTRGCPPEECKGKKGRMMALEPTTDCGVEKGLTTDRIKTGMLDITSCCTQHGCTKGIRVEVPSPVLVSSKCQEVTFRVVPFHSVPDKLGFARTSSFTLKANFVNKHGWSKYNFNLRGFPGEEFIKCCGFTLGVGGAWFQAYLNGMVQGDGAASADDVKEKLNGIIDQINKVNTLLEGEIEAVRRIAYMNQASSLQNQVEIGLIGEYLNISSWLETTTLTKTEEGLMKNGWCQSNTHCWCPPKPTIVPTIGYVDSIKEVTGTSWWMVMIHYIIVGLIVIVVVVFGLKLWGCLRR
uniref:Fusion protein n=1 Tax=Isavirus salaris TaxID=55987 RepID=A7RAC9_9ORTO|nr:fusion protein [Infectious salmon anemia virus]ABE98326.1 fusion protein [Infectious salmon anemia virus]